MSADDQRPAELLPESGYKTLRDAALQDRVGGLSAEVGQALAEVDRLRAELAETRAELDREQAAADQRISDLRAEHEHAAARSRRHHHVLGRIHAEQGAELDKTQEAGDALAGELSTLLQRDWAPDYVKWVRGLVSAWWSVRGSVPAPDRAGDDEPRPGGFCCSMMAGNSTSSCTEHADDPASCPDVTIAHSDQHGPGLPIPGTAGGGQICIRFCPWCGTDLTAGDGHTAGQDEPTAGEGDDEVWIPPADDCMNTRHAPCPHCSSTVFHHRTGRCGSCGRRPGAAAPADDTAPPTPFTVDQEVRSASGVRGTVRVANYTYSLVTWSNGNVVWVRNDELAPADDTAAPADGPMCRYCGADCSGGRSWDGGDLYACQSCADARATRNAAPADDTAAPAPVVGYVLARVDDGTVTLWDDDVRETGHAAAVAHVEQVDQPGPWRCYELRDVCTDADQPVRGSQPEATRGGDPS